MVGERTLWGAGRGANIAYAGRVITEPKQDGQSGPQNLVAQRRPAHAEIIRTSVLNGQPYFCRQDFDTRSKNPSRIRRRRIPCCERSSVIGFPIVEGKGFVPLKEKLANVDRLGVLAVGPATLQVCGTIDMIIIWASKDEVVAQCRFESRSILCFISFKIDPDEFGQRFIW